MVQIPSNIKTITLSVQEREAIQRYSKYLDRYYYDLVLKSANGMIALHEPDYLMFRSQIRQEMESAANSQIHDIFAHLFNRLSSNPVSRRIAEEIASRDFASIEDVQREAKHIMADHNTRPDPEMGGLSPTQVAGLLYVEWDAASCPIKLNPNLSVEELGKVPFFYNARVLLNTLIEMQGEPTATETCGLLNKKITSLLLDRLVLGKMDQLILPIYIKRGNVGAEELKTLIILRVVCQCADLIHLRKKQFLVKKKYQDLLLDENAGQLYHRLFVAYFKKYNMGYADRLDCLEGIQATMGYILYRIQKALKEFTPVSAAIGKILLPAVQEEFKHLPGLIRKEFAVGIRLLEPLESLGIIECKWSEVDKMPEIEAIRKSALLDRFIEFTL